MTRKLSILIKIFTILAITSCALAGSTTFNFGQVQVDDIPASWDISGQKAGDNFKGSNYQTLSPFLGSETTNERKFAFDTGLKYTLLNVDTKAGRTAFDCKAETGCTNTDPVPTDWAQITNYNGQPNVINAQANSYKLDLSFNESGKGDKVTFIPFSPNKNKFMFESTMISGFLGLGQNSGVWGSIYKEFGEGKELVSSLALKSKGDGNQFDFSQKDQDLTESSLIIGGRHYTGSDRTPTFYKVDDKSDAIVFKNVETTLSKKVNTDYKTVDGKIFKGVKKNVCVLTNNNFMVALYNDGKETENLKDPKTTYEKFKALTYEHLCNHFSDPPGEDMGTGMCPSKNPKFTIDRVPPMYFKFFKDGSDGSGDPETTVQINPVDWIYILRDDDKEDAPMNIFTTQQYIGKATPDMYKLCGVTDKADYDKTVIVGKLFMLKAEILYKQTSTNKYVGVNYMVEGNGKFFLYIAGLTGALIVSSIFSMIILSKCNKGRDEEDDEENQEMADEESGDGYAKAN